MGAQRAKAADKSDICKKMLPQLKKRYPQLPRLPELPVLETMLFAVCLENLPVPEAEAAYQRLLQSFHDMNELRVSSIDEVEAALGPIPEADWRALRIRNILQHVFEANYTFELDGIKRKTLELAQKQISKVKALTPFVRAYTLHTVLGAHLLPIDDRMHAALVWLHVVPSDWTSEQTSEGLRGHVRKADGAEFCQLLRALAVDPQFRGTFRPRTEDENGEDISPLNRLDQLLKGEVASGRGKKTLAKKQDSGAAAGRKSSGRKSSAESSRSARPAASRTKPAAGSNGQKADKKSKKPPARSSR